MELYVPLAVTGAVLLVLFFELRSGLSLDVAGGFNLLIMACVGWTVVIVVWLMWALSNLGWI